MKKRLLLSFMMIALVAALVGGATFAAFTSSASNSNNSFTSGSINLLADGVTTTNSFNVTGMIPGATGTDTFAVSNNGTLALRYKMTLTKTGDTGFLTGVAPAVIITVKDSTGTPIVFDASGVSDYRPLAALTGSENLTVEYSFPDRADNNDFQGKTGSFSIALDAVTP